MSKSKRIKTSTKFIYAILGPVFWVLVWQLAASLANRRLMFPIPLPLATVKVFLADLGNAEFLTAIGNSLIHILTGYLAAAVIGIAGGMLSGRSALFCALSDPMLHVIRAVPVAAFIFIAWLWVPSALLPSVISALMVVPVIWSHAAAGMEAADEKYAEMAQVFGMSNRDINLRIRFPLLEPHLRNGAITGLGIAWKAGVAAEVICNPTGSMGALLQQAKAAIDYEEVFAVVLAVVLLSVILERILKLVWKEKYDD